MPHASKEGATMSSPHRKATGSMGEGQVHTSTRSNAMRLKLTHRHLRDKKPT